MNCEFFPITRDPTDSFHQDGSRKRAKGAKTETPDFWLLGQRSGQIDEESKTIPFRARIAIGWLLRPHFRGYLRGSFLFLTKIFARAWIFGSLHYIIAFRINFPLHNLRGSDFQLSFPHEKAGVIITPWEINSPEPNLV